MGSNPISLTHAVGLRLRGAVFDTSTLQAIHRAGVLGALKRLFPGGVAIPASVARQTKDALRNLCAELVPDLADHSWIEIVEVQVAELEEHGTPRPDDRAVRRRSAARGALQCCGYTIDREEFEVVALAKRMRATAVLDDHAGLRCAANLGVRALTTLDTLASLRDEGEVADELSVLVQRIQATGYFPTLRISKTRSLPPGDPG